LSEAISRTSPSTRGEGFDLFFNCLVDIPDRNYLLNPMFARVGANGELSGPPTMVLPDVYVER
jgi:hypothetical protein